MKFYESHFEEYLQSRDVYNIHPELNAVYDALPTSIAHLGNIIMYGPPGVGKYTQCLRLVSKYSSYVDLKYNKRMTQSTDKQTYKYHISDIHYEVDMSLLGCNSKVIWHEVFQQILDIVAVTAQKTGIIVCKNFHAIHSELLDIFYSYMQQYRASHGNNSNIHILFFIITEHISFLPSNIVNSCEIVPVCRPAKHHYEAITRSASSLTTTPISPSRVVVGPPQSCINTNNNNNLRRPFLRRITDIRHKHVESIPIIGDISTTDIINLKELYGLSLAKTTIDIPPDVFNTVCDAVIFEIIHYKDLSFIKFRETIYDILVYNLDVIECVWTVLRYFLMHHPVGAVMPDEVSIILSKTCTFLKYFNNNYRPIYHIESFMFNLIELLQKYDAEIAATITAGNHVSA